MDRRRCFDPDPDPKFHFDAEQIRIRIKIQNDADPQADSTPSLTHVRKSDKFFIPTFTADPVHIGLSKKLARLLED